MKPLLLTTSPKYLRRLAKELNLHSVNGFYINGLRYNKAKCSTWNNQVFLVVSICNQNELRIHNGDIFIDDGNGNNLCASRYNP